MSLFKGFGIIILPAFAGGSALALYDKFVPGDHQPVRLAGG
jgi:hypothetical protein